MERDQHHVDKDQQNTSEEDQYDDGAQERGAIGIQVFQSGLG